MRIGPYELGRELGRGAMGVVYEGHDPLLDRAVAIKLIPVASEYDEAQLRREARAAAKLRHPNLVAVHAAGATESGAYLAMDLVEGPSLKEQLRQEGRFRPRRAARIALELAQALHYAHSQGVLHRDVKPQNVLLDRQGHALLADFGLSKLLDPTVTRLTATGDMVGTPAYAAPEQLRGEHDRVGPHTDVYALGAVLYEMLCGQRAFSEAENSVELAQMVLHTQASLPAEVRRKVGPELERICLRCLEKDPELRYPNAGELARALERYLEGRAPAGGPAGSPWHQGAAGLVLGVLGTLGVQWLTKEELTDRQDRLYERGMLRQNRGDDEGAIADFKAVLAEVPKEAWIWARLGLAYDSNDQDQQAIATYDEALKRGEGELEDRDMADIYNYRALARWQTEDYQAGFDDVERSLELDPENPEAWHTRGLLRSKLVGPEAAMEDQQHALQLDPRYAHALFDLAMASKSREQPPPLAEVVQGFEKVLEIDPDFAQAYISIGLAKEDAKDIPGALKAYQQAIDAEIDDTTNLFNRRGALQLAQTNWIDAYADFSMAQALQPDEPANYYFRAAALANMGVLREAITDVDKALDRYPADDPQRTTVEDYRKKLEDLLKQRAQGR